MSITPCLPLPVFVATLAGNIGTSAALANSPPTLTPIANLTINEDAGNQTVPLSGIGSGAPSENQTLTITAVSSNPSLVPNPTITYISPDANGILSFKAFTNEFGTATITIIVNDGQPFDHTVVRSFLVTVVPVNDAPAISSIEDQAINENTSTGPIPFKVADVETSASALMVSGNSSNPTLVPAANLVFAGSGASRTVTVIPTANQFGTATITVTANDGSGGTVSRAFTVTVNAATRIARAGDGPSGLYQITSGTYIECCGLAGDIRSSLPNGRQRFVRLTVDPQRNVAAMAFLGNDMQTVFSVIPCPPGDPINFSFDHGLVFSNHLVFHVDHGGPPYQKYWNYTVSNSADNLRIEGVLGTLQPTCADVPERFSHSNVVAVLVPPPMLSITGVSSNGARLFLQGHAGLTNVIEASTDLVTWVGVSTNVMDYSLCPICPFAIFEDSASTNLPRRFYRAFEIP